MLENMGFFFFCFILNGKCEFKDLIVLIKDKMNLYGDCWKDLWEECSVVVKDFIL